MCIFPFFASNASPFQNLVHTNSLLKQKYSEFEMHEKIKKSGLSKCKIKTLNMFSSLVIFIRYAMVLSFFKS